MDFYGVWWQAAPGEVADGQQRGKNRAWSFRLQRSVQFRFRGITRFARMSNGDVVVGLLRCDAMSQLDLLAIFFGLAQYRLGSANDERTFQLSLGDWIH